MSGTDDVEEPPVHLYGIGDICLLEILRGFLESASTQAIYILSDVCKLGIGRDALADARNGQSSDNIVSGIWSSMKDSKMMQQMDRCAVQVSTYCSRL